MQRYLAAVLVALALLSGCAKKRPKPPAPPQIKVIEEGVASWYGPPYHGRAAASGEIYDMEKLTAAHRTLPFGTMVRVRNLTNEREVEVRVNDRGPFVKDRIIDLSKAAAREIHMIGPGTARVQLRVLALPVETAPAFYAVQAGAFRDRTKADRLRAGMEQRFGSAQLQLRQGDPPLWRVLVGRESTTEGAEALAARIRLEAGAGFVVRVEPPSDN
ncbi:MAG TPA: septal ring lytic transglycosylase RlpA family protein [Bryobacteraceae bacterium]|nr:septal ring lytic transglycosylase RlpA family protein [Bryobacteraceae bacterium]